ncbi:TAXI family TRAP transporter solute-binding subunit [Spongiactinospora gelatinilytica]|nr:TAXI family TRAP transporter solute-binding subunit [Spongiactinospora gelatinilytica]
MMKLSFRPPMLIAAMIALLVAGCGSTGGTGGTGGAALYKGGRLSIATGNTTGVYYQLGGGYADLVGRFVPGYQATAETTAASVENIQRVARGDSDIAFTLADAAADAVQGKNGFSGPQPIRALARLYANHTHVIARTDAGIGSVAAMRGKRVSIGSPNSGTEVIARRLLTAAGIDPRTGIAAQSLSLPETVQGMKDGTLDAFFWSGGLPTGGVTDLTVSMGDKVTFVPLNDLLPRLRAQYGEVYQAAPLKKEVYDTPADVPGIAVPNLLIVSTEMPDALATSLTALLFDHRADLTKVHPEAANIVRAEAQKTTPVPLHPGAERYFAKP